MHKSTCSPQVDSMSGEYPPQKESSSPARTAHTLHSGTSATRLAGDFKQGLGTYLVKYPIPFSLASSPVHKYSPEDYIRVDRRDLVFKTNSPSCFRSEIFVILIKHIQRRLSDSLKNILCSLAALWNFLWWKVELTSVFRFVSHRYAMCGSCDTFAVL